MKNAKNKNYYLSLDIGTDSVGYAATDENYNLLKFHGEPVWGATVFDAASLNTDRRTFRTARRRLDRRQQRIDLLQQLFAKEIGKIDPRFFIRLKESTLWPEDKNEKFTLFNDNGFTDKEYHKQYHTIHHLIDDLMESKEPHDVRLVYLACAWLVAHRGHFLTPNLNVDNIGNDFNKIYDDFFLYFKCNDYKTPWSEDAVNRDKLAETLKKSIGATQKYKELCELIYRGKPSKDVSEDFPFSQAGILKLLAGGTCKLSDLFGNDDYDELENKSVSLGMDEEKFEQTASEIGDDYDLIAAMRPIYDWARLIDILAGEKTISKAKIETYKTHKKDLAFLKHVVRTYVPEKYNEVFRRTDKDNYAAYSHHTDEPHAGKWRKNKEEFSKFILGIIKEIEPDADDKIRFEDMKKRLEIRKFMPKQKDGDNCVIPHQLYFHELKEILRNASKYLPFLNEKDEDGISVKEKIEDIFLFKIPYFVGPLNERSNKAWLERHKNMEKEKIYPWNFEKIVNLEASEEAFIQKLTNKCSYIPLADVLPKDSLIYHKFEVLNEINNLKINGEKISVGLKQRIFNELFMSKKKVTRKNIENFLVTNNFLEKGNESELEGIDITIKSDLSPHHAFKKLMDSNTLTEKEVEETIKRSTYAEDKSRLSVWLEKEFPNINEKDRKYICGIKIKDFGRLSREFLDELQGINKETGEQSTILGALWNTNYNLMEIIESDKFTFKEEIEKLSNEYYSEKEPTLEEKLDEMYISNAVKRPIYRALDIIRDITKAFGKPAKIFIETTRGGKKDKKGNRTNSRREQILELYKKCSDEDVQILRQQLEKKSDNELQSEKLFLYFMQLGRCMYTWNAIDDIDALGVNYDIDHIYPQSYVKDDSLDNKVLVYGPINKNVKKNEYPIPSDIRNKMLGFWEILKEKKLISEEKFKRLTRSTPFTEDEKLGFINRQLVETSQAVKAIKTLLEKKFSGTEIVCCKASLASEFRNKFKIWKSRLFNDLHHAVNAYLNIVTGNVYNMKFTKKFFNINSDYSIKIETIFTHPLICDGKVVWDGLKMLAKVKETAVKNNAHFTKFAFFKKGGLFDQMPVPAAEGLIPRKKDLPTEKYGGYDGVSTSYLLLVRFYTSKKSEVMFYPVPLMLAEKFEKEDGFAEEYILSTLRTQKNNKIQKIEILLKGRKFKINSVLSLDGFRVAIAAASLKDGRMAFHPLMQFSHSLQTVFYIKKLEKLVEKTKENSKLIYDAEHDMVTVEENLKLYDIYLSKLQTIYSKRPGNGNIALDLANKKEVFSALPPIEQAKVLLQIHSLFCRNSFSGIDLSLIGLSKKTAIVRKSLSLSSWKSDYNDVRIIDSSASGLWEKESENLLELLKV